MFEVKDARLAVTLSTHLSAGGRGGAGVTGVFAADPVADVVAVESVLLLVFVVGGQRVEEEDPGDQSVQDGGEQQRQHEKDAEIKEVNGQIKLPGDSVAAGDDGDVVVHQLLDV